jgi:hypothetical protein
MHDLVRRTPKAAHEADGPVAAGLRAVLGHAHDTVGLRCALVRDGRMGVREAGV